MSWSCRAHGAAGVAGVLIGIVMISFGSAAAATTEYPTFTPEAFSLEELTSQAAFQRDSIPRSRFEVRRPLLRHPEQH